MTAHAVGRIVSLFRYPVKSMTSESLDTVEVGWNGLAGDRRWAFVRDGIVNNGFPWMTIRQRADMWHYKPRFVEPDRPDVSRTMVTTPSGQELDVVDPALAAQLGDGVSLIRQTRGIFDTFPLSLISTRTIEGLSALTGMPLQPRRFRPNILVETFDDAEFPEDYWVGSILSFGDMKMRVDKRDKRCVVTNVDPDSTERDPVVLRTIQGSRDSCLGVYGTTVQPGRLSVGDSVTVES
ncbi:MAG TPA: MOSC N-terminal beta barrel domain-containing protein [Gemmatimonadaceae bacterium]|nr:MOSC N-terminal beta barrel domain-containing protein [Gemmatimonadaceae bacterium]